MDSKYIAYPIAMNFLKERWNAKPHDLAAWLFWKSNGLKAYTNVNELIPPPEFKYGFPKSGDEFNYLKPLMSCWFLKSDIDNFVPPEYYIPGKDLIERWKSHTDIDAESFVMAKIKESRLSPFHPIFGITKASCDFDGFPEVDEGLFSLLEVEKIEKEDLIGMFNDIKKPIGHLNHDLKMQTLANSIATHLYSKNKRKPTKAAVAIELRVTYPSLTPETIARRFRKEW